MSFWNKGWRGAPVTMFPALGGVRPAQVEPGLCGGCQKTKTMAFYGAGGMLCLACAAIRLSREGGHADAFLRNS